MLDLQSLSSLPSLDQVSHLDVGVCAGTALALVALYVRNKSSYPYPPGPKGLPVIGNVLDVPPKRQWIQYAQWSCELDSPIIRLNMLGTNMIILNDLETTTEFFERRGLIYSNRPRMPMLNEACGFGWNFGFCEDIEQWKVCRKEFDTRFRQITSRQYREHEVAMTHVLLGKLLNSPERFMQHLRYMTGSLILDIAYGIKVKPENDEYIEIAEKGQEGMEASGDPNIVDILPWVQHLPSWLPGMRWKKKVDVWKSWSFKMRDTPYEWVKAQLEKGLAKPSITTDLIAKFENQFTDARREYLIKSTAATAYSAGSDTTVSAFNTLFLVLTLFPEVQKRAHAEIDRVVGSERLPEFADEDKLPYITAIIKEILRWAAFVPFAVPHMATQTDVYKGYIIPKNALVIGNSWAILHDPVAYPDPETFNPSRFLTADGMKINPNVQDPEVAFGYGRRICPGRFMALDSMWISTACILAMFNIGRAVGNDGKVIPLPEELFNSGLVTHPTPFQCSITPRSKNAARLIQALAEVH